jgi:L-lactate dehydrogenase complex protein LldF
VRQHALQNLPQLLEQLEQNLTRNGVQVHWARDAEANQLVLQIAQRAAAKK